ncbi:MAG: hypothetical protein N3A63_09515 [Bacteroidetes bacterium]|nr:hypothetical protein [Bacteroidota bacterium]
MKRMYSRKQKHWVPLLAKGEWELLSMHALESREGVPFKLKLWDWWYYAKKIQKTIYTLDESEL